MEQEKELEETFLEEFQGAMDEFNKQRYKNSVILLSKAMFALCDIKILTDVKRLPKNHGERFRILEDSFPEIYSIVDNIWSHYVDAYSKPSLQKSCEDIKNAIKEIIRTNEFSEKIKKSIE